MTLTLSKYLSISLTLVILWLLNLSWWHSSLLGSILGLFYLVFYGYLVGISFFKSQNRSFQVLTGIFVLISFVSLIGAIIYFFYQLNTHIIAFLTLLVPFFFSIKAHKVPLNINLPKLSRPKIISYLLSLIYSLLSFFSFYFLFTSRTTEAIRTPWEVIPSQFFLIYFLATFTLLGIILSSKNSTKPLFLIITHIFLSLSVTLLIYPLGYGFDSFIHQATEKVIFETGLIIPKPLYYLGQYSLVIFLAKLFQISTLWIDRLLVPVITSLFLPLTIYHVLSRAFNWRRLALFFSLLLILPFGTFIVTTPFALASVYLLITIFLAYQYLSERKGSSSYLKLIYFFFLSLVTLAIHPLVGIPSFILSIFIKISKLKTKLISKIITPIFFLLSSIILPLIFIINFWVSNQLEITFSNRLTYLFDWSSLAPYLLNRSHLIKNIVYLYGFNFDLIFIFLIILGLIIVARKKQLQKSKPPLYTFLALIINFIILKGFLDFSSLIFYERGDYGQRILILGLYFLIPFLLIALYHLSKKILVGPTWLKFSALVFWSLLITLTLYLSYPRHDDYAASRQFNVSAADIKAVHYIQNEAGDDYAVLANQSVSAAALQEFGFRKYFDLADGSKQFYYPIPTGSPLYNYYLKMVYEKASKITAAEAMSLLGVDKIYFIVNNYWNESPRIIEEAKESSSEWISIDEGKIWIFKYE